MLAGSLTVATLVGPSVCTPTQPRVLSLSLLPPHISEPLTLLVLWDLLHALSIRWPI